MPKLLRLALPAGLIVLPVLLAVITLTHSYNNSPNRAFTNLPEPTLRELAKNKGIELGNFAIRSRLNEPAYKNILTSQFSLALADNTPNWHFTDGSLRPARNKYNFTHLDEVVDFAQDNKMNLQMHHYLWGEEKWLPDWLKNGDYTKNELMKIIKNHIYTVGSRYSGKVNEWTVVNEAFTRERNDNDLKDWWGERLGRDYIDDAFIWARKADPNSKLILNDFNNESINEVSNSMYEYIKEAKKRGVPIDGIGMQMHIDGSHPPNKNEVASNMKRFGDLGVKVYVTEFDVNMNDVQADEKAREQIQESIYYEMTRACIESSVCGSFAILGITDQETWYNYMGLDGAKPLLFDKNYQPKPAYFGLRHALEE